MKVGLTKVFGMGKNIPATWKKQADGTSKKGTPQKAKSTQNYLKDTFSSDKKKKLD